jgi:hypothetical protein
MSLSDTRLAAQAAFVARRVLFEELARAQSPAAVRKAVELELQTDRERERALDDEVGKLLRANAAAIQSSGADYAEMFRKAKRMLAAKKGIPL